MTKRAERAAMMRSQCISIVVPTPIAAPFTAAISGFCIDEIVGRKRDAEPSRLFAARAWKSVMSLPEVNVSPVPVSNATRSVGSASTCANASAIASYISRVSAFFFSGRLRRISSTPPVRAMATLSVTGLLLLRQVLGDIGRQVERADVNLRRPVTCAAEDASRLRARAYGVHADACE